MKDEENTRIRPAQAILNEIRDGDLMWDLAQELHKATANVREYGKKATVTLTIEIGTLGENHHQLVQPPIVMRAEATSKLFKPAPAPTVFFIDHDGNALRTGEKEPQMGLELASSQRKQQGE